jgi:hypothetical protein
MGNARSLKRWDEQQYRVSTSFLYMYSSASSYRKRAKAASWGDGEAIKERRIMA